MEENAEIKLYPRCLPALGSGTYKVSVELQIQLAGHADETYKNETDYEVAPVSYAIDGQVAAIFPANGAAGAYSGTLPYITFSSKTLPWQQGETPWLALLSLRDGEAFSIKTYAKDELHAFSESCPGYDKAKFEKQGMTAFSMLELPLQLFLDIMPTGKELPYLAHVREAALCSSQSSQYLRSAALRATENNPPAASVVLSNRLPGEGLNTMVLVAAEGLEDFITAIESPDNRPEKIQLVVLKKWSFICNAEQDSFSAYLDHNISAGLFKLPAQSMPESLPAETLDLIENGFVPLSNNTGDRKALFYRGPLMPLPAVQGASGNAGALKASYDTARQLGRLLCLQNKSIAAAVFNNRISNLRHARVQSHQRLSAKPLREAAALFNRHKGPEDISDEPANKELFLGSLTKLLQTFNAGNAR